MELPKTLLQAIALGVVLSATTTACSLADGGNAEPNLHNANCTVDCTIDHSNSNDYSCPACGMG